MAAHDSPSLVSMEVGWPDGKLVEQVDMAPHLTFGAEAGDMEQGMEPPKKLTESGTEGRRDSSSGSVAGWNQ